MTSTRDNAARSISTDEREAARTELQRWMSRALRTHRELAEVSQRELGAACFVEQSRIVRWEDERDSETAPAWAVLAWLRHDDARIRAIGMGVLGELALEGRAAVSPLPHVSDAVDDVVVLSAAGKELGESLAHFASTVRSNSIGELTEARRQVREGVVAGVVMDRRLTARIAELAGLARGPRKAR